MQIGSLILTEAESGGGDVIPADTMMKDGMEGTMGQFRVKAPLDVGVFDPSPMAVESRFPS